MKSDICGSGLLPKMVMCMVSDHKDTKSLTSVMKTLTTLMINFKLSTKNCSLNTLKVVLYGKTIKVVL